MTYRDPFACWFAEKQALLADSKTQSPLPTIEINDGDPPAFQSDSSLVHLYDDSSLAEKTDVLIEVETWLGCFDRNNNRITIWRRGVELASRLVGCDYADLLALVFAHELGHWFHDTAATENGQLWTKSALDSASDEYHEAWAQWFTWLYAKEYGNGLPKVFDDLEKRQSELYKVWNQVFSKEEFSVQHQKKYLRLLNGLKSSQSKLGLGHIKFENSSLPDDVKEHWRDIVPSL